MATYERGTHVQKRDRMQAKLATRNMRLEQNGYGDLEPALEQDGNGAPNLRLEQRQLRRIELIAEEDASRLDTRGP